MADLPPETSKDVPQAATRAEQAAGGGVSAARQERTVRLYRSALAVAVVVIIVLVALLAGSANRARRARMIGLDGQGVCLVRDQAAARSVREYLLRCGRGALPGKATFAQRWEEVVVTSRDQRPLSVAEAVQLLQPRVTVLVEAAAIVVDGAISVKLPTPDLANEALGAVKALYVREGERIVTQRYRDDVTVRPVTVPPAEIVGDVTKAVAAIARAKREPESYPVKAGDVPDKIAAKHGMKLAELYALNPGLKGRNISAGERLTVSTARPLVTVVTVKDVTRKEAFEAPLERVLSPNVPKGKEVVERPGTPGERVVSEQQTCENRRVVRRTILQQAITVQPVAKRVLVGPPTPGSPTAAPPKSAPVTRGH
jgi:LysM repeat protein